MPQIALRMCFSTSVIYRSLWGAIQTTHSPTQHPHNRSVPHFPVCTRRRAQALTRLQSLQRLCGCGTSDRAALCRAAQQGPGGGGSPSKRRVGSRPEPSRGHRQAGKPGVGPCWFRWVTLREILPLGSLRSPQHTLPLAHFPLSSQSRIVGNMRQIELKSS